jgi:hypothetical protein
MARLPWRAIIGWAAVGWIICLTFTLTNLATTSDSLGGLVDARHDQPTAPLLQREIGDSATRDGGGHDGAFFYALAEAPLHPDEVQAYLDGPRYRAQRIFFPLVVWALHPTGGGPGLVDTMFVVGALGVLAGGIAMGALAAQWGGSPRWGVAFGLLPGSWISLRISTPDPLALALALLALLVLLRGHLVPAVLLAAAAVLTKEPLWLVPAGYALYRRDRDALVFAAVPGLVAALWWLYLHQTLPARYDNVPAFTTPFVGWEQSVRFWAGGAEPIGLLSFVLAVGLALAALVLRRGHPMWWTVVLNVALAAVATADVLGPERNGSRTLMVLQVVALIALATPAALPDARRRGKRRIGRPTGSLTTG